MTAAQKAVDLGFMVVKEDLTLGRAIESKDNRILSPYGKYNHPSCYFHLPEAGDIRILTVNGKECLDCRQYEVHQVGGAHHKEFWVPAEKPEEFNEHLSILENGGITAYIRKTTHLT